MCFGTVDNFDVHFNGKLIEQVPRYKYLGTIVRCTKRINQDIFSEKSSFICDKSRKSIFGLQKKVKFLKILPPEIRFEVFDTMIKPVLTYSDVWGINKNALHELDRVFVNYVRCVLCVKLTTSNVIVIEESDKFPPSLYCHINVSCFFHHLLKMQPGKTVKSVFDILYDLNYQGFQTWISKAYELSWSYDIDMDSCTQLTPGQFKHICYERVANSYFVSTWLSDLRSGDTSIARIYQLYKSSFGTECYLTFISNPKLKVAVFKLRASSHDLEIERGRYVRPKLNVDERLCLSCNVVEDEEHFVTAYKDNEVD